MLTDLFALLSVSFPMFFTQAVTKETRPQSSKSENFIRVVCGARLFSLEGQRTTVYTTETKYRGVDLHEVE